LQDKSLVIIQEKAVKITTDFETMTKQDLSG